jgi:hypothetical protein
VTDERDLTGNDERTEQMGEEEAREAAEIRADIDQTQARMGGTLGELGDRLDPGNLINEAKENVRDATIGRVEETTKETSQMVVETIKRNPIPAALAGIGLLMLWNNRSDGKDRSYQARRWDSQRGEWSGQRSDDGGPSVGDRVSGAMDQVSQTAGDLGSNIGQTASQMGSNIGDKAGEVGYNFERAMDASPLAMGAIALGAGAVVGALIPETEKEREVLGDAGRQIGDAVKDTVDQAASKAEEALSRTEEKITSEV